MPLMRWERVIGTALGVSITCFGGDTYERCVGVNAMFHDGICLNAQLSKSIRRSSMLCCSYTVVWWLFQSLAATFTLLTSKDAPPKMKKREKRDTSGEKHHGPRNGII